MILFKCVCCGKQKLVSQDTVICPNCGNHFDMLGINGNVSLKNRIDEYKANRYKIYVLEGNMVRMFQDGFTRCFRIFSATAIGLIVSIVCYILLNKVIPLTLISLPFSIICMVLACQTLKVSVSLTLAGEVEEKGNISNKRK